MTKYLLLLLVALTFLTFHPILWNEFVTWDDGLLITENPIVQELSFSTVRRAFTTYDPELYIPLTFLSYQVDHLLWGLNPVGFHLTNLILHTLNTLLVFWLMTLLLQRFQGPENRSQENSHHSAFLILHSPFPALAITFLWALHPLNTEAVAWAAARKDLLSGGFFLLSLCTYLKWREGVMVRDFAAAKSSRTMTQYWYWSSVITFLLGLLAKVSIAPLPLVLLLLEWFLAPHPLPFKGEGRVRVLRRVSPYFLLSILFGIVALGGKHGNTGLLWEKALIGAKATIFYLGHLLWPTGFSVLYPYTRPITWSNPDFLLPILLVLLLSALAVLCRRRWPAAAFGWAFFLLMLLPSFTNFAKGHDQLRDVYFASDRYAYLPSIGILLPVSYWLLIIGYSSLHRENSLSTCLPAGVSTKEGKRVTRPNVPVRYGRGVRGMSGLLGCVLFLLYFLSYKQSFIWRNTETLFQNVLRHYPDSHIAWNNLGGIALERGDMRTALEDYGRSIAIRPNAAAFFNLGQIALQEGLPAKAMELYRRAILSRPNDRDAHVNLGVLLLRDGQFAEASAVFQQAITIDNTFAPAHFNLGLALSALGDRSGARRAFTNTLALDPSDQEAREKLARLGS